ncbi:MAG: DUF4147 domain-containing protein [Desulfobacteraceae bacterium]|nr:DUF4147 domain-containing protein [Desulfobacteraceae bacterium]
MIKNKDQLSTTKLRKHALEIVEAALKSVIPKKAIQKSVKHIHNKLHVNDTVYDLNNYEHIYVVGFGKSSALMAQEIEYILNKKIRKGIVISTKAVPLETIEFYEGSHPFPSKKNIAATKKLVSLIKTAGKNDLIICLISGGGSALLFYPTLPLDEYNRKMKAIFNSGADIFELNRFRKKLSKVKDGKLAKITRAKIVSLIFSDVIGDDLGTIASGPTFLDNNTFSDKNRVDNHLLLTNKIALSAMENKAKALGYSPVCLTRSLSGEASKAAKALLNQCSHGCNCGLFAGETTVNVKAEGIGGRNQEFCLGAVSHIKGDDECVIVSIGTDGQDGPGHDAAGAIVCNHTLNQAKIKGLDPAVFLEKNDAYHFFKSLDALLFTGITGSNVADIGLILKPY